MQSALETRQTIPNAKRIAGKHRGRRCHLPDPVQRTPHMTDATTNLQTIRQAVAQFTRDRDWGQFHAPKNLSMAIAAEAAELMEH